jgi:hypothetical protein
LKQLPVIIIITVRMSFNTAVQKIVLHGRNAAVSRAGAGGVPVNMSMLSLAPEEGADIDGDPL